MIKYIILYTVCFILSRVIYSLVGFIANINRVLIIALGVLHGDFFYIPI